MAWHSLILRRSIEQTGFTLIELMIGMAVAVIVVAAAFTVLTTTSKALRANEQVVDTQQNYEWPWKYYPRYQTGWLWKSRGYDRKLH